MIQTVNTELIKLVMWLNINKLSLNIDKTKYIIFSIKKKVKDMPDVTVGANVVERVKSIKFLGVIIDENVSWTEHIYYIKNKISKGIGILCKARKVLKPSTKQLIKAPCQISLNFLAVCKVHPHRSYNTFNKPEII